MTEKNLQISTSSEPLEVKHLPIRNHPYTQYDSIFVLDVLCEITVDASIRKEINKDATDYNIYGIMLESLIRHK